MPTVMQTSNGKVETLLTERDFAYLIEQYMGYEAAYFRSLMEEFEHYRGRTQTMTNNEKWLPVVGYENHYLVSNMGRVMNRISSKILRVRYTKGGYARVNLSKNGRLETVSMVAVEVTGKLLAVLSGLTRRGVRHE